MSSDPGRFCESWTTSNGVELGAVAEPRRAGEVAISVTPDTDRVRATSMAESDPTSPS